MNKRGEHFRSSPRPQVNHQVTLQRESRPNDPPIIAYTRNISTGGLFVETVRDFEIGEKIKVTLSAPSAWEPLVLMAEIRRIDPGNENRKGGIGLHFIDVADNELVALIELTATLDYES